MTIGIAMYNRTGDYFLCKYYDYYISIGRLRRKINFTPRNSRYNSVSGACAIFGAIVSNNARQTGVFTGKLPECVSLKMPWTM